MTFLYGFLSSTAFWGVIYWLYIHGKLPGIEARIMAELTKLTKPDPHA